MNRNKSFIKKAAFAAAGVMIAGQMAPSAVFAADSTLQEAQGQKEETVYVKTDPEGTTSEIIVSDWLKNPNGEETLEDTSDLTEIENVKGEEGFTRNGDKITWAAGGNDIFYQGKTTRELPVSVEISYYLDGQKIDPKELAGKSGHVKIVFDYKNKIKQGDVYTPFVMATGLVLPAEKFSKVEVTNGRLVSDGEKNIVIGIGVPGMNENLNLKDSDLLKELDIDFPESFTMEADADDFELTMSMTVASNLDLSKLDLDDIEDKDELQEKIDEMKDGATQLVDGTGELADGVQELKDSCQDLIDGMNSVDEGAGALNDGIVELNTKKNDLVKGINDLADGIDTLNQKKGDLINGVDQLADGINTLNNSKGSLVSGVNALAGGAKQVDDGTAALQNGAERLAKGAGTLNSSKDQLTAGVNQLAAGINGDGTAKNPGLLNGAKSLKAGLDTLAQSVNGSENAGSLSNGAASLKAGIGQLKGKVPEIQKGVEGIKGGIDSVAAENSGMSRVIGEMSGYLNQGTAAGEEDLTAGRSEDGEQIVTAEAAVSLTDAAPDMAAQLQASLDSNRSVLASLQGVKGTVNSIHLPKSMESFAGTYNGYVGELDSCIAQLESAIAAQESALAQMQATQTVEVEVPAAVKAGNSLSVGSTDTVTVERSVLTGWIQELAKSRGTLQYISSNIDGFMEQLGSGTADAPGLLGALDQLEQGAQELSAGVDQKLAGGISQLQTGAEALTAGIQQVSEGINSTYDNKGNLKKMGLKDGMEALGNGISQVASGATDLKQGTGELKAGTEALNNGAAQLQSGAATLSDGVGRLAAGAGELQSGAGTLGSGVQQLANGGAQLRTGGNALADGIEQLAAGSSELKEGTAKLAAGGAELGDGVDQLNDGALELRDGMDEFNEKAVEKITGLLEDDLQEFIDRVNAVRAAGESYRSFSGSEKDGDSVKFIIETGSIEKE